MAVVLDDEGDGWVASIIRSQIDQRVWVVVIPDVDMLTGAMAATVSLRRAKAYAERATRSGPLRWKLGDDGEWEAYPDERHP